MSEVKIFSGQVSSPHSDVAELNFSTGQVTYSLNGKVDVTFNPSDPYFVERLYNTFSQIDKRQGDVNAQMNADADSARVFELSRALDGEIRRYLDGLFGVSICEPLFGDMQVTSIADGLPVWANLLLSIMDTIDDTMAVEQKKTNPRIAKYTAKYSKYHK